MEPGPPYLLAEDVLLLALDPASGRPAARLWPQLFGGCLLADLALRGHVSIDPGGVFRFPEVAASGPAPADPLLAGARARLGDRPMRPEEAGLTLGFEAHQALLHRLAHRGDLERREVRSLGRTRAAWPALDTTRRDQVGHHVRVILEGGPPDPDGLMAASILAANGLADAVLALPEGVAGAFTLFKKRRNRAITDPEAARLARSKVVDICVSACGEPGRGELDLWELGQWFD